MPKPANPIQNLKKLATEGYSAAKKIARAENKINNELSKAVGLKKGAEIPPSRYVRRGKAKKPNQKKRMRRTNTVNFPDKDTMAKTCIHKREFVTFVNGSTGVTINSQPVSMQNAFMFPWGSSVLPQYELYQLKNLHFHFESTYPNITTGGSLGVIVMGIVYDPDDPTLADLSTMLNYQGFQNRRIDKSYTIHWDPRHNPLPVRYISHNPNANPFNDAAVFYWATNGNPNTNQIGELWVEYDIELFIPRPSVAPTFQEFALVSGIAAAGTYWFADSALGSGQVYGQNYATITQRTGANPKLSFNVPGFYLVIFQMNFNNTGASVFAADVGALTNCVLVNGAIPDAFNSVTMSTTSGSVGDETGTATSTIFIDASSNYVQGNTTYIAGAHFTVAGGGTPITGSNHGIWIIKVPKPIAQIPPQLPEITKLQKDVDELKHMLEFGIVSRSDREDCVTTPILNHPPTPAPYFNNWVGSKSQSHK